VNASAPYLSPSEAARRLGVSAKALRLYEQRGLVAPLRTAAGWRAYGPDEMARAGEIAALRALGLSLAQVARVLGGDSQGLEPALAAHQARLEGEGRRLAHLARQVRDLRAELAAGRAPAIGDLVRLAGAVADPVAAFDLPWPWGGERFELRDLRAITYIVGPLGSGKTRLAMQLAEALPGGRFLPLDRGASPPPTAAVQAAMAWLEEEGAHSSPALLALLAALEDPSRAALVVDMVEDGLDEATQTALVAYLRKTASAQRPLFLMTRSCAILDLAAVGPGEAILLCPANHSLPMRVAAIPGAPGYEAVATCLAPPEVRARTHGLIAMRPPAP
jgi:DNA-binding transcriptional MerR regulator